MGPTARWWRDRPLWLRPRLAIKDLLHRLRVRWPSAVNRVTLDEIRNNHLKANVSYYEDDPNATVHWDRAWIDPGGTIFGAGPYAKVPITLPEGDEIVIRVYPPARLRRRLGKVRGTA